MSCDNRDQVLGYIMDLIAEQCIDCEFDNEDAPEHCNHFDYDVDLFSCAGKTGWRDLEWGYADERE